MWGFPRVLPALIPKVINGSNCIKVSMGGQKWRASQIFLGGKRDAPCTSFPGHSGLTDRRSGLQEGGAQALRIRSRRSPVLGGGAGVAT